MARRCKGCGRRLSGSADAESCPLCEPKMKVRQARRAARREAEQRVTQRWGSQDPVKIARECGIDMSGPMDRGGNEPPKPRQPSRYRCRCGHTFARHAGAGDCELCNCSLFESPRGGSVHTVPSAIETNRRRH
jgi:hypothetical protein